MSIFQQAVT